MDLSGSIKGMQIDYYTRKTLITLEVNEQPVGIEKLMDKVLSIKLTLFRKKRSLDSNAYFHVLCDKLRQTLGISMAAMKNDLITTYGQIWYMDDGQAFIYKTNATPEFIREREEVHLELIKIGEDGAYWYRAYRGSHTYNTEEMARLIQGTVMECKDHGIETATPEEIERMQRLWEGRLHEQGSKDKGQIMQE
ncbi:hypothetical protein [Butyrivibrio proteoclasticus]|uniref:hypothetical protein n=1 Tax=Butyrivibrio proteoclasticus TaxID=43305 RepID=UPI000686537D|nr:hypothetical protein [Butyrivibrio proteoclasticus]